MRRQDRENPAVTGARNAAHEYALKTRWLEWKTADRAACRRRKAALPPDQYQAFVAAARAKRAEVLAGIELVGQTVSKRSRELVVAGIDSELRLVADLRGGQSQEGMEFAEGEMADIFS